MPIGVPKVKNTQRENKGNWNFIGQIYNWVDIYTRMSRNRVLFLTQKLQPELTNQLVGVLLYLRLKDKGKTIAMYVNSSSLNNSFKYGLTIVDVICYVGDTSTINFGIAASVTSLIIVSGDKGRRLALPNARFNMYLPVVKSLGQAFFISREIAEKNKLLYEISSLYVCSGFRPNDKRSMRREMETFSIITKQSKMRRHKNRKRAEDRRHIFAATLHCLDATRVLSVDEAKRSGLIDQVAISELLQCL